MRRLLAARIAIPGARAALARRGFSLIELLVAIIILGLGLLGLAALFPVVIREQRIGTDNVLGVTVSNSARAVLTATAWERATDEFSSGGTSPSAWRMLLEANNGLAQGAANLVTGGAGQQFELGEWWIPEVTETIGAFPLGTTLLGEPGNRRRTCGVPLASRVYPGEGEPQMVWDFAVQRVSDFNFATGPSRDRMRAAIFVRRIDQRIRTNGRTLRDVLLDSDGTLPLGQRRFPVGADNRNIPTLDGTNGNNGVRYARLMTARYRTDFQINTPPSGRDIDRITQVETARPIGSLMAQLGQKFVDNLGNIYTVVEIEREQGGASPSQVSLRLSPPIPASALRTPAGASGRTNLQQLLFSPNVPASVVLTEINP